MPKADIARCRRGSTHTSAGNALSKAGRQFFGSHSKAGK